MNRLPPCVLTADDWCPTHKRRHVGAERRWALSDTATGAAYRAHWLDKASRPPPRPPAPCLYLGPATGRTVECLAPD